MSDEYSVVVAFYCILIVFVFSLPSKKYWLLLRSFGMCVHCVSNCEIVFQKLCFKSYATYQKYVLMHAKIKTCEVCKNRIFKRKPRFSEFTAEGEMK